MSSENNNDPYTAKNSRQANLNKDNRNAPNSNKLPTYISILVGALLIIALAYYLSNSSGTRATGSVDSSSIDSPTTTVQPPTEKSSAPSAPAPLTTPVAPSTATP